MPYFVLLVLVRTYFHGCGEGALGGGEQHFSVLALSLGKNTVIRHQRDQSPSNNTPRCNCNVSARNSGHYAADFSISTPSTPLCTHQNIRSCRQTQRKKGSSVLPHSLFPNQRHQRELFA